MDKKFYDQQGDVLLVPVESFPGGLTRLTNAIVQEGEHTGHAHKFEDPTAVELFESPTTKQRYLRVLKPANLLHEEHKKQTVQPGDYTIHIIQEFDHFEQMVRKVVD